MILNALSMRLSRPSLRNAGTVLGVALLWVGCGGRASSGDQADAGLPPVGSGGPSPEDGGADGGAPSSDLGEPPLPEEQPDPTLDSAPARPGSQFAGWASETLDAIERDFRKPGTDLYRENMSSDATSFNWGAGTQLHALIAGGRIAQAETFANAINNTYWCNTNGRWGYNASAGGCGDRYYDDNAWVAKALMELYQLTHKAAYLDRAKETVAFSMSGENPATVQPYGGIRWHEGDADGQCLCATAPTMVANLMIYRAGGAEQYKTDALRLYNWIKANRFGYGPGYRGYENAVVTQGAILLWQITGDRTYLDDAHHFAYAMESTYIDWETHALRETGQWGGHDMTAAYVDLYNEDKDVNWLNIVAGYLEFLHEKGKDANGRYPETWSDVGMPGNPGLLYQAAAARAFGKMGGTPGGSTKPRDPVAVFKDCNYTGVWRAGLLIGRYTTSDLQFRGIGAKDISSLRVQPGYRVTLYKEDNFGGESLVRTADDSCLVQSNWNDAATSLVVERVQPTVVIYRDCNYSGAARHLLTGSYDEGKLRALGISPQSISSIQVSDGYEALLYSDGHAGGAPYVTGTTSCLVASGWNDKAASIVVRRKAP
jgi:hypothetical protein